MFWSARRLESKRFLALTGSLTKGVKWDSFHEYSNLSRCREVVTWKTIPHRTTTARRDKAGRPSFTPAYPPNR